MEKSLRKRKGLFFTETCKRIKSFTIIEVLVVMLLSGIITAILYYSFDFLNFQYIQYNKKQSELLKLQNLCTLLKNDFEKSDIIILENKNVLKCPDFSRYWFTEEYILREQDVNVDTFYFPVTEVTGIFNKEEVNPDNAVLDNLSLSIVFGDDNLNINVSKKYSNAQLFNYSEK